MAKIEATPGAVSAGAAVTGETNIYTIPNVAFGSGITNVYVSSTVPLSGITWDELSELALDKAQLFSTRTAAHDKSAYIWRRGAGPLAWLTAVLAAVSGLAVVGDSVLIAPWIAVITAIVAGTNAALSPGETARKHRNSALAYDRLRLKVLDFQFFDLKPDGQAPTDDDLKTIRETFRKYDEESNAIAEAAPPLRGI